MVGVEHVFVTIQAWLSAFRLRTLPLAAASITLGSFLAASEKSFNWKIAFLCYATAILLQILSNLANDYGDTIHGADNLKRIGPKRATQSGTISITSMRAALLLFAVLCLMVGYQLVKGESFAFYVAGICAIMSAVAYTAGPKPYGYAGLGDLFVFLFFGLVAVFGTYFLHTHQLNLKIILPAISSGLFCVAVLNINNIRDIESDKLAGKYTIPVRFGRTKAEIYHWTLLIFGFGFALVYVLLTYKTRWQFLFLLALPLVIKNGLAVSSRSPGAELDPYLKQMVFSTLLFSIFFGLGHLL